LIVFSVIIVELPDVSKFGADFITHTLYTKQLVSS
jgi:hypothetical protein